MSKKGKNSNSDQKKKSNSEKKKKEETHYQRSKREKLEIRNEKIKLLAAEQQLLFAEAKQKEEESIKLFDAALLSNPWVNTQLVSNNLSLPQSSNTTNLNRINRINLSQIQLAKDIKTVTTNAGCTVQLSNKSPPNYRASFTSSSSLSSSPSASAPSSSLPSKKVSPLKSNNLLTTLQIRPT